jgi:hypothetical protein
MADNPYAGVGIVAVGDHFVPRPGPGARVARTWRAQGLRPANLSVLGHHRTGKSSLVHWAAAQCPRPDLRTVFVDVGTLDSGDALFRALVRETLRWPGLPDALAVIGESALTAGTWDYLHQTVTDFFAAVRRDGRYVMIVLDEFDRASRVCRRLAEFQLLRSLASEEAYPVGLITISRRRVKDIEIDAAGGSILDGVLALRQPVGMFAPAEGDAVLGRALVLGADLLPVRDQINGLAGLHPYLLELLCFGIVERFQDAGEIDVDGAYEGASGTFADYFDRLAAVIESDLGEKGLALIRELAAGAPLSPGCARELSQCRQLGIVTPDPGQPALFAPSFARHLLAR